MSVSAAVIGGGVIGLATAWRLAARGHRVTLIDPDTYQSASWVAGGMLAPVAEAWPGEESVLDLGLASLRRWPGFAHDLGGDLVRTDGTVLLGVDSADRAVLGDLAGYLGQRGIAVETLSGKEIRRMEPSIGPAVRGGLHMPDDLAVDNRALLRRLLKACELAGVRLVRQRADDVRTLHDGSRIDADVVVLAAGAWSCRLHPALSRMVRPIKGEILRMRARVGSLPPPRCTVRGLVQGRAVYLVPRDGGELVLGATQYEAGFDTEPLVGGVRDLITDAEQLLPGIADYVLTEVRAGLRAGSVDNLPFIGELEPGVFAATGHHRNGLLLAPITADAVCAIIDGGEIPAEVDAASPRREGVRT
jgi:glycine oxidase